MIGRFCCPIDSKKVESFNPFEVPYLDRVFNDEESSKIWNALWNYTMMK